jgi:rSAM/selenodomain-associated transferase 2
MGVALEGPYRPALHRPVPVTAQCGSPQARQRDRARVCVVIPALDEGASIGGTVAEALAHADEVVVADGGSADGTAEIAAAAGATVVRSPRGRALQMNAGAAMAGRCDVLLFLHADCRLPADAGLAIRRAVDAGAEWGRFDVTLDSRRRALACVGMAMNLRSRVTGICTGDQAIFVTRSAWQAVGGYPPIPLMEDVALSARLRRRAWPACLRQRVIVSARRWERHGVLRTILTMWWLRALYWAGTSPRRLHRIYYGDRR